MAMAVANTGSRLALSLGDWRLVESKGGGGGYLGVDNSYGVCGGRVCEEDVYRKGKVCHLPFSIFDDHRWRVERRGERRGKRSMVRLKVGVEEGRVVVVGERVKKLARSSTWHSPTTSSIACEKTSQDGQKANQMESVNAVGQVSVNGLRMANSSVMNGSCHVLGNGRKRRTNALPGSTAIAITESSAARRKSPRCMAAGGNGQSEPVPDDEDDADLQSSPFEASSSRSSSNDKDDEDVPSLAEVDWRTYRAQLVAREQEEEMSGPSSSDEQQSTSVASIPSHAAKSKKGNNEKTGASSAIKKSWAHALPEPEPGCVLIATEELDGYPIFQRSVVLLLGCGANDGPFGVVLNLPKGMRMRQVNGLDTPLIKAFGSAVVHMGGPIDSRHFLVLHGKEGVKGFDEVMKGVYCGSTAGMEHAISMVNKKEASPDNFKFYFGYAGWGSAQLKEEIASGWWYVAACSSDLITGRSTTRQVPTRKTNPPSPNPGLWEELLDLMGGKYADVSERARQKGKEG